MEVGGIEPPSEADVKSPSTRVADLYFLAFDPADRQAKSRKPACFFKSPRQTHGNRSSLSDALTRTTEAYLPARRATSELALRQPWRSYIRHLLLCRIVNEGIRRSRRAGNSPPAPSKPGHPQFRYGTEKNPCTCQRAVTMMFGRIAISKIRKSQMMSISPCLSLQRLMPSKVSIKTQAPAAFQYVSCRATPIS
jgi:hypothetical protein